jgi:DNA-binding response OmpR family regulator
VTAADGVDDALAVQLRVLVVEDDYYLAHDAQRALEDAGATVLGPCARMGDCMSILECNSPDCAVIDINLGSGPTFEIPAWLRDHGIPFVFLTGYDADVIPADFADVARLEKPIAASQLLEAVQRLCSERERPI